MLQPRIEKTCGAPEAFLVLVPWLSARLQQAREAHRKRELDSCGTKRALRRGRRCRPGEQCICVAEAEHGWRRARCPR
eukprot:2231829-Pleurochrysis_carterae.AAC.1